MRTKVPLILDVSHYCFWSSHTMASVVSCWPPNGAFHLVSISGTTIMIPFLSSLSSQMTFVDVMRGYQVGSANNGHQSDMPCQLELAMVPKPGSDHEINPIILHDFCICQILVHVNGLAQDCGNSSALTLELVQSCTKPSMWIFLYFSLRW